MLRFIRLSFALCFAWIAASPAIADGGGDVPDARRFIFNYAAKIAEVPPGARTVDLWLPVPADGEHQQVRILNDPLPAEGAIAAEPRYGNRIFHARFTPPFETPLEVELRFEVTRREVWNEAAKAMRPTSRRPPDRTMTPHLGADRLVPLDGPLATIAATLDLSADDPLRLGRVVYDYVLGTMRYDKSEPGWGRGDALRACRVGAGNCTDFHSVFIGLNRTRDVPSYFEIGFALPPERGAGEIGGYHCWAWFHAGEAGWVPVDASEADKHPAMAEYYFGALTPDRVAFSVGRDLTLTPPQAGEPLNFFVYPYVEVDNRPHAAVETRYSFRDLE